MTHDEAINKVVNNMVNYKPWKVEALYIAIKALEQAMWIPVNEELPEESGYYLITGTYNNNNNKYVDIAYYYKQSKLWDSAYDEYEKHYDANTAIAWKPLPEPYRAESEGEE